MEAKKILLAEDDSDDQNLFYEFLGHRTDIKLMPVVEDGVALLHLLENIPHPEELPDLIILDQNMPKRTGLQTLQCLKEISRFTHIPVVIYSTYTDTGLVKVCSGMGACAVKSKPITMEGYNQMIDEFLKMIYEGNGDLGGDMNRQ